MLKETSYWGCFSLTYLIHGLLKPYLAFSKRVVTEISERMLILFIVLYHILLWFSVEFQPAF